MVVGVVVQWHSVWRVGTMASCLARQCNDTVFGVLVQ